MRIRGQEDTLISKNIQHFEGWGKNSVKLARFFFVPYPPSLVPFALIGEIIAFQITFRLHYIRWFYHSEPIQGLSSLLFRWEPPFQQALLAETCEQHSETASVYL